MKKLTLLTVLILVSALVYFYSGLSVEPVSNEISHNNNQNKQAENTTVDSELLRLLAITDSTARTQQLTAFFQQQVNSNPISALTQIEGLSQTSDRELCYYLVFSVWLKIDRGTMEQWLVITEGRADYDFAFVKLLSTAAGLEQRLLFANKMHSQSLREKTLSELIMTWVVQKPKTIVHWAITDQNDGDKWLALAFKYLSASSQAQAIKSLTYLNANNIPQVRVAVQAIIDNYQFGIIGEEALTALKTLNPQKIRDEAIMGLMPLLVNEEQLKLADIIAVLEQLTPSDIRDELNALVALKWAGKEPIVAANYAEQLTGSARSKAIDAVMTTWIEQDLEAASEWLKGVDGDIDQAAATLGRGSARLGNVQISDEWLNKIKNDELRAAAAVDVIQGYYDESPEAGIYHLVYQKNLTTQQKLDILHEIYPNETFLTPEQALDNLGPLEGLSSAFE